MRVALVACALALAPAGALRAQSLRPDEATVRAPGAPVERGTGFATAVDVSARGALAGSVGELLDEAPGVHVRRTGDGFAPQTLTLRGAPGAQVVLALDGVVLNDAASDGVDLSLVPPAVLERVEVHRGAAPLRLGVGGLAGAAEMITRAPDGPPRAWLAAAWGSFGQRRVTASVSGRSPSVEALACVGYRGTDGDFPFYDDRGSPRLPGVTAVRRNAAADAVDAMARACQRRGDARGPCATVVASWRRRGVPGPGSSQSDGPSASQRRVLARVSVPWRAGALRAELWGAAIARDDVFDNTGPAPLLDTAPYVARSVHGALELGATGVAALGPLRLEPTARLRREGFVGTAFARGGLDASRLSAFAGVDAVVRAGPLRVAPGAGVEWMRDAGPDGARDQAVGTARVGAALRLGERVELRANGGWFERAPTLPELLGDRGFVRGNPSLRPERAWSVDAGAVLTAGSGAWRARAEVSGYYRDVRDLIALVQVGRSRFQPFNLGAARVAGVEAQARVTWGRHLAAVVSWAWVDARVGDVAGLAGRRVPAVPEHDLYASLTGRVARRYVGEVSLTAEVSHASSAFLEETNDPLASIPARTLVGVELTWRMPLLRALSLGVQATNLLDQRTAPRALADGTTAPAAIQDFQGYPLPGRAWLATLRIDPP